MVLNFCLNIMLHVISTNFETGLPRYNLSFSGEVETLSCCWYGPIVMKLLSEQFLFLKLCQKDNLLQSRETLKLLLIKINFTFSGSQHH